MKVTGVLLLLFVFASAASAQLATGGGYVLEKSVIGNGGNSASGGTYEITGTTAQSAAGVYSNGGPHGVRGGFWQPSLAPTAAPVAIIGRITAGRGISRVRVYLTDMNGITRLAVTNNFGYYRFDNVQSGQDYVLNAQHRHYLFTNNPRLITANDDLFDVNFIGERIH